MKPTPKDFALNDSKDKAAQSLGRRGGKARTEALSPKRRAEIARHGCQVPLEDLTQLLRTDNQMPTPSGHAVGLSTEGRQLSLSLAFCARFALQ
jgi:hypothetical protein